MTEKLRNALIVLLLNPQLREMLQNSDPEALKQALTAVREALALEPDAEQLNRFDDLVGSTAPRIRITREWSGYNGRRYSKPWVARITAWPIGRNPELTFGGYLGGDNGGTTEIMARVGDVLRYGQKDTRGNGGLSEWAIVQSDGTTRTVDQTKAREAFGK